MSTLSTVRTEDLRRAVKYLNTPGAPASDAYDLLRTLVGFASEIELPNEN